MVYFKTYRPDKARQNLLKAIELYPDYVGAMLGMAYLLTAEGKRSDALSYIEQAIGKGATLEQLVKDQDLVTLRTLPEWDVLMKKYFSDQIYYNLACEHSLKGELDKGFEFLQLSLSNGWKDYDWMQQDTDLISLRAHEKRWQEIMKKYFPDQFKEKLK
ncbi:MAG: hypothetical protein ABIO44_10515 [Saprospiraceae bacterium]